PLNSVGLLLQAGGGTSGEARFDNLNYPPAPVAEPEPPPPAAPGYIPIADDFNDAVLNRTIFFASSGITESDGTLNIPADAGWQATDFDLRSRAVSVEVRQLATTGSTYFLVFSGDQSNRVGFEHRDGALNCFQTVGGVRTTLGTPTYNASLHRWWRLREQE